MRSMLAVALSATWSTLHQKLGGYSRSVGGFGLTETDVSRPSRLDTTGSIRSSSVKHPCLTAYDPVCAQWSKSSGKDSVFGSTPGGTHVAIADSVRVVSSASMQLATWRRCAPFGTGASAGNPSPSSSASASATSSASSSSSSASSSPALLVPAVVLVPALPPVCMPAGRTKSLSWSLSGSTGVLPNNFAVCVRLCTMPANEW